MGQLVRKVSVAKRQDPLIDFTTLAKIGRHASRSALAAAALLRLPLLLAPPRPLPPLHHHQHYHLPCGAFTSETAS